MMNVCDELVKKVMICQNSVEIKLEYEMRMDQKLNERGMEGFKYSSAEKG